MILKSKGKKSFDLSNVKLNLSLKCFKDLMKVLLVVKIAWRLATFSLKP